MKAIAILGDSLACPRPWEGVELAGTYAYQLQQKGGGELYVMNWSAGDATSARFASDGFLRTYVTGSHIHAAVIHVGICDCAPRLMNGVERVIGAFAARAPVVGDAFRSYINMKKRYRLQLTRWFPRTLVERNEFERNLRHVVDRLRKESGLVKLVFVNIAAPGERLAAKSYNVRENIVRYNDVLHRISAEQGGTVVDIYSQTNLNPMWITESDGHHIRREAHDWIAREIAASLGYGN